MAVSKVRSGIKTRILILSDTHSALPDRVNTPDLPFSQPFPLADLAIHCGDLTSTGKPDEHHRALQLLKSLPAPVKLVIPGNHDLTLDRPYCSKHLMLYGWRRPHTEQDLEEAESTYTSAESIEAGVVYLVEGTRSFNLPNGAHLTVYASAYTPEFYDWGFAYPRNQDRFNSSLQSASEIPTPDFNPSEADRVSVMITHGPPKGVLDKTTRGEHVGCDNLMRAVSRCKPLLHCFGHIHEGWGGRTKSWLPDAELQQPVSVDSQQSTAYFDASSLKAGDETVFVNASIMDVHYQPCQKPWLVDLMLPAAQCQ